MAELDLTKATVSDMTTNVPDATIEARNTDGALDQEETEWQNSKWSTWLGIYKTIPEVKVAIDMRAVWTIGNGYTAEDPETTVILDHISGWGTDTFNSILKNMMVTKRIGGDAFAEIIRDDSGILINLKPLDPGSIKIIVDRKGVIKRYEQVSKTGKTGKIINKFNPEEILHLTNKRVADEIHGVSDIEAIENIIKANKESFDDFKTVVHRNVVPLRIIYVDLDDQDKINALTAKYEQLIKNKEVLFVPKGTMEIDTSGNVNSNSVFNPLPWREHLKNYFFQVVGIPQIILGSSGEFTEATAKIAYLAFEQSVDDEQNDIESQVWNQLGLRIELSFPASLRNELLSDNSKDGANNMQGAAGAFQPNETTAGSGQ